MRFPWNAPRGAGETVGIEPGPGFVAPSMALDDFPPVVSRGRRMTVSAETAEQLGWTQAQPLLWEGDQA